MNNITRLFGIQYPIIQAGMVWCSGWKLAAAVSNAGGLGIIGAGSMSPDVLREHIQKCKAATSKPFAVNVPLLYSKGLNPRELLSCTSLRTPSLRLRLQKAV
jgi:enoyl-[acyl-carrier protein] reductase II